MYAAQTLNAYLEKTEKILIDVMNCSKISILNGELQALKQWIKCKIKYSAKYLRGNISKSIPVKNF